KTDLKFNCRSASTHSERMEQLCLLPTDSAAAVVHLCMFCYAARKLLETWRIFSNFHIANLWNWSQCVMNRELVAPYDSVQYDILYVAVIFGLTCIHFYLTLQHYCNAKWSAIIALQCELKSSNSDCNLFIYATG